MRRLLVLTVFAVSCLSCTKTQEWTLEPNTTEPTFVVRQPARPDTVILYIHGVFGDTVGTWKHASGTSLIALVDEDPEFKGRFDAYAFGYPSRYLKEGSFTIAEAAEKLKLHAKERLMGYRRIIIVAHSMGGLVAMKYLLRDRRVLKRVPAVVLYATPQQPVHLATVARHVARNSALFDMSEAKDNRFFDDLERGWKDLPTQVGWQPALYCAYEKRGTLQVGVVVPAGEATRYCSTSSPPIDTDHIGIVKPASRNHDTYLLLAGVLRKHAAKPAAEVNDYSAEEERRIAQMEQAIARNHTAFPDVALADSNEFVREFPDHANAYRLRGNVLFDLGRFSDAAESFRQGLEKDPAADVRYKLGLNLASALLAGGRHEEAAPAIAAVLRDNPRDGVARVLDALQQLMAGQYTKAGKSYEALLADPPAFPGALPFIHMGLGLAGAAGYRIADQTPAAHVERAMRALPQLRAWFFSPAPAPLVIDRWNYTIYRPLVDRFAETPEFRKLKPKVPKGT